MMMWLNMDRKLLGEMLLKIAGKRADGPAPEPLSRGKKKSTSSRLAPSLPSDKIATGWKTRWMKL